MKVYGQVISSMRLRHSGCVHVYMYRRKMYCHEYGKDRTNVCVDLKFVSVCFICFYLQGIKIVILPVCQYQYQYYV
jgi:hypothetical protein